MSGRVTSSGYMPPVCSNSVRRSDCSLTPKRSATPGSHHTGSTAALVTEISRPVCSTSPSIFSRPASTASETSGPVSRARVTAIVGRRSSPSPISLAKSWATRCPHGSSETILFGSLHCANGPTSTTGAVSVRSGRTSGFIAPDEIARAR